ncbi:MAG TPA: phosphatase PAP2 family protein [Bacteroidales bacterium]|nr:phosphatase PAP2 family protein [Bacteroidales bacterium]HPS26258.1 phosphatase PAP2 family protein [Bacteroidales bacterium]
MIDKLIGIDVSLFLFLNDLRNPFFDFVFWWASVPLAWLPVYVVLLYLVLKVYRWQSIFVVIFIIIVISLTDQISVHFFKETFMRLRPCHNPEIQAQVDTLNGYCGGQYGFVSSHAANYFGIATYLSVLFFRKIRFFIPVVMLWASLIAYSRLYLGVHYPADICGGAILGIIVGLLLGWAFKLLSDKLLSKRRFFRMRS